MNDDSSLSSGFLLSEPQTSNRPGEPAAPSPRITDYKPPSCEERERHQSWCGQLGRGELAVLATPLGREGLVLAAYLAITHASGGRFFDGVKARAKKVVISTTLERAPHFAKFIRSFLLDQDKVVIQTASSYIYGATNDDACANCTQRVMKAAEVGAEVVLVDYGYQPYESGAGKKEAQQDAKAAMDVVRAKGLSMYALCTLNGSAPANDVLRGMMASKILLPYAATSLALIEPHYAHSDSSSAVVRLHSQSGSCQGAFKFEVVDVEEANFGLRAMIDWGKTLPGKGSSLARYLRQAPPKPTKQKADTMKPMDAEAAPAKPKDKPAGQGSSRKKVSSTTPQLVAAPPSAPDALSHIDSQALSPDSAMPSQLQASQSPAEGITESSLVDDASQSDGIVVGNLFASGSWTRTEEFAQTSTAVDGEASPEALLNYAASHSAAGDVQLDRTY